MNNILEKSKILVIDDEPQIRKLLKITLEANLAKVIEAFNGQEGINFAASHRPDLILLDMGLGDMKGIEVLKKTREWSDVPIIILSVENSQEIITECLDNGADDYVTKPFEVNILLSRIKVCLRRNFKKEVEDPIFKTNNLKVDLSKRLVWHGDQEIKLTSTEYDLLKFLVKNAGKVVTHRQILKEVWGPGAAADSQYPRVYVRHLRSKIEDNPNTPQIITTESGVGYRLNVI